MSDLPRFCLSSWVWVTVLISFDPPTGLSTEQAPDLLLTLVLSVIQEIAEDFPDGAVVKSLLQCRRRQRCRFASWVRKIPWSRKWQPAPIFLPGKHHVQRSLAGYSPWGCKELGTPKHAHTHTRTRTHTRARTHTHTQESVEEALTFGIHMEYMNYTPFAVETPQPMLTICPMVLETQCDSKHFCLFTP